MKKIFAIALALVMVLSMASAFASYCTGGFDWTCATKSTYCGQGKVEVVPFVKVNNGCGGYEYEESTCAAAVASENIYWAVKLTVDANPDMEWWNVAKLVVEAKETNYKTKTWDFSEDAAKKGIDFEEDETVVYYALIKANAKGEVWIDVEDEDLDLEDVVFSAQVKEDGKASKVKVCATLTSLGEDFVAGIVGEFFVTYEEDVELGRKEATAGMILDALTAEEYELYKGTPVEEPVKPEKPVTIWGWSDYEEAMKEYEEDYAEYEKYVAVMDKVAALDAVKVADVLTVYTEDDGAADELLAKYYIYNGKVYDIETWKPCGYSYADVEDFFGIKIGTCIDQDIINANFGWDFEQEFCLPWSDKAASIVNAECVVAIPKTGDASVLAWLF